MKHITSNLFAIMFIIIIVMYIVICMMANGIKKEQLQCMIKSIKYLIVPYGNVKHKIIGIILNLFFTLTGILGTAQQSKVWIKIIAAFLVYFLINFYINISIMVGQDIKKYFVQVNPNYLFSAILPLIIILGTYYISKSTIEPIIYLGKGVIVLGFLVAYYFIHKNILNFIFERQSILKEGSKFRENSFSFVKKVLLVNILLLYSGKYALIVLENATQGADYLQLIYDVSINFFTLSVDEGNNITFPEKVYNVLFILSGIIIFSGFLACALSMQNNKKDSGDVE